MNNKKGLIISILFVVLGALLICYGIWGDKLIELTSKQTDDFYPSKITEDDVGNEFNHVLQADSIFPEILDMKDLYTYNVCDPDYSLEDEDLVAYFYAVDSSSLVDEEKVAIRHAINNCDSIQIKCILRKYDSELEEKVKSKTTLWIQEWFEEMLSYSEGDLFEGVTSDMFVEENMQYFTPYYLEVTEVSIPSKFYGTPFIIAGAVVVFVALLFLICFVFDFNKKKVIPVVLAVPVALLLVASIVLFNHLRTFFSIHEVGIGLYEMENKECTNTDGLMEANIDSIDSFISWAVKEHFFNLPLDTNRDNFGCAAFAATTPDGEHIFGRNFDYDETDTMFIYSHPEGKYASIGFADMAFLDVGEDRTMSANSIMGKAYSIVLPYAVMDGMNEKGLGVGILELMVDEVHQDTGKPPLLIFLAMRAVLDNCADVEEAIALLEGFDIYTDLDRSYHLFLTDKTGNYAVLEWFGNEMFVNRIPAVTNSVITPGPHFGEGHGQNRLEAINNCLGEDRVVTKEEAMQILGVAAEMIGMTEWSCVYNLDDFTVEICLDADYDTVYTFKASDFE